MVSSALHPVERLLDIPGMERLFSRHIFPRKPVSSCRLLHLRHKPGRTWIASYALGVPDDAEEQIVYLRVNEVRGSQARYLKSCALGHDVRHIPDVDGVAWIFPSDRKLAGLGTLCDSSYLETQLLPALVEAAAPGGRAGEWRRQIVHYLPERSCMVRIDAAIRCQHLSAEHTATFYGKTYPDDQGAETFRCMSRLWSDANPGAKALGLARPLLYQPDCRTLWQSGVDGAALNVRSDRDLEAAARALAVLHRSHIPELPSYAPVAARLDSTSRVLVDAMPEHRDSISALCNELQEQMPLLSHRAPATLHGDLHLKNFLVQPDCVALIDLDTLAAGDPIEDVASFAAALYCGDLASGASEEASSRAIATFVLAYERASGCRVPKFDLNWHLAAAVFTERVFRAVTRMKVDSAPADVLLDTAWRFADNARGAETRKRTVA